MPSFTLEELGAKVEEQFAPTKVELGEAGTLVMRPIVQLNDEETAGIARIQRELNSLQGGEEPTYVDENGKERDATEEERDEWEKTQRAIKPTMLEKLADLIRLAAGEQGRQYADAFINLKGQDLGFMLVLVKEYGKSSQLGEA